MALFSSVTNLREGASLVQSRRYGVIVARSGKFSHVRFRPWPKVISIPEIGLLGSLRHRYHSKDECRVYYNQPLGHSSFLALRYVESGVGTSLLSVNVALAVLDEIARLKRSDALLCDAASLRLSDRVMRRYGWESHKPSRWHRNFIKRFYGQYPQLTQSMRAILYGEETPREDDTPDQQVPVRGVQPSASALDAWIEREHAHNVLPCSSSDPSFDHHDDLLLTPALRRHIRTDGSRATC